MEFVGEKCYRCKKKFGKGKPESTTEVEPFPFGDYRIVTVVAPCPSCGKDVPVWAGDDPFLAPEPAAIEPEPELEPAEPAEPVEPVEPAEPVEPTE